ncbi:MAG: hypothetical protein V4582_23470 [Pseudomonadota bacterium]
MNKLVFIALLLCAAGVRAEARLTALETKWLGAAEPVLVYARASGLPLDIIVQPQAGPDDVPFAMGYRDGRCKLVLSMRGNAQAEAVLAGVAPSDQALVIEAMTAHEVAHCWRINQGVWHALPAGFVEVGEEHAASQELLDTAKALRQTRREEGYADLVALAWTRRHHGPDYARVMSWLERLRAEQPVAYGAHDTRAWLRLAHRDGAFDDKGTPFEDARALWGRGLLGDQ